MPAQKILVVDDSPTERFFLAAISLYMNVFLLPVANRTRLAFEKAHIWNPYDLDDKHVLREVAPGTIVYIYDMNMRSRTASR